MDIFRVEVPTTDGACTHGCRDECGNPVKVDRHRCYVLAKSILQVARKFPSAVCITRVGIGYTIGSIDGDEE